MRHRHPRQWSRPAGLTRWQMLIGILLVAGLAFAVRQFWMMGTQGRVSYPYWCPECQAVFDVSELGKDPEKWKMPPGARSDSVVFCLRCKKGAAYPAATCPECGTVHVLHLWKNSDCPKCHPEIARDAAQHGIELMPQKLQ